MTSVYRATNMRPYAQLLLAIFVLNARAATIPDQIQPEIEKELINDDVKPPVENISSEQELIDQSNTIKDVQNNLRNSAVEDIPVEIILEEVQPAVKTNTDQETSNEVASGEIQRLIVDLKDLGPPQRQEHDTQSPEHHEDAERAVAMVKENIKETQTLLRQGFQGVTDGIQSWYVHNEHINDIQSKIKSMQEHFVSQIQKLNETLQNYSKDKLNPNEEEFSQIKSNYEQVESRLKILQNNFNNGVRTLSEGVVATLRDESVPSSTDASTSSTSSGSSGAGGPFMNWLTNFQTMMSENFANVTQAITNLIAPNQNSGIQNFFLGGSTTPSSSSEAAGGSSTTSPSFNWPNFSSSITNLLNPNQGAQTSNQEGSQPAQNGPFSFLQNSQLVQNIAGFFQPNKPDAQASSEKPASETKPEPEKKPERETKPEPEKKPEQTGPIRQLLENNPVVQGITGAVQRIQGTINNPEKPRETEEKNESEQEKGGLLLFPGQGGHGGPGGGNVDAWGRFVTALVGTIGAVLNGTISSVSTAVNGFVNSIGNTVEGIITVSESG